MAAISVIIVSHDKPKFVRQAIDSVLNQTFPDWEGWLVDSGVLLNQGFFDDIKDPRLKIMVSGEDRAQAQKTLMAGWCFNNWLNSGSPKGELILYLCDDDFFYPRAFEIFWNYYIRYNRERQAMYASQDVGLGGRNGKTKIIAQRLADLPAGKFCNGRKLDRKVDYLQFCHTRKILDEFEKVYGTRRYHSEDKNDSNHADGIFMEQIGALTTIFPIPELVSCNRRTPQSTNCGTYQDTLWSKLMFRAKGKLVRTWQKYRA
ncbi:MAG: glycosyltransferase [Deltaproteobacteria bacterium]|nr:glycosyltransferase [Deltaproteobacteria bacterium]